MGVTLSETRFGKMTSRYVSMYLIHSYIYYVLGTSVIPDEEYDYICGFLERNFVDVGECGHPHRSLITTDRLKATTAYDIKDWPVIVKHAARLLIAEHHRGK